MKLPKRPKIGRFGRYKHKYVLYYLYEDLIKLMDAFEPPDLVVLIGNFASKLNIVVENSVLYVIIDGKKEEITPNQVLIYDLKGCFMVVSKEIFD